MMVGKVSSSPSSKRAGYHYHLRIGRGNVLVLGAVAIAILVIAGTVTYASFVLPYGNVQDKTFSYENVIGSVNGRISATLAGIQSHENHNAPHYPTSDSIGINPHIGNNPTVPYEYTPSQAPITTPTITYFTATNATGKFIRSATPINITTTGLNLSEIRNANGSITLSDNINGNVSYSDAGFVYYNVGPLSSIQGINVSGNASVNLWFDQNSNGEYFAWNNNTYSGLGSDNYGMANGGLPVKTVNNSTVFNFLNYTKGGFSLKELKEGKLTGIDNSTEVAIWVGIAISNPSNSALPSSKETTVSVSISRSALPVIDAARGWGFSSIQAGIVAAQIEDTIQVAPGTYNGGFSIAKSLTLESMGGPNVTTIALQPNISGSLYVNAQNVTIDGFTIKGFDYNATSSGLASENIFVTPAAKNILIQDNTILVGQIGPKTNGDDGTGILTTYTTSSNVSSVVVTENVFKPVYDSAFRAFYINPGVSNFLFSGNTIIGNFSGASVVQAGNGLVKDNAINGNGASAGFGTWGYPNASVYGHTTFINNTISGTDAGISIWETDDVAITDNTLEMNGMGIWVGIFSGLPFNGSTISVSQNTFKNNTIQYVDTVNSTDIQQTLTNNTFDRAVVVQHAQIGDPEVLANISDHIIWSNIADAVANSSSGDTVKVLPGIYPSTSPIIITTSSLWIQSITGIYNDSGVYLNAASPEINLNGRPPSYFQLGGSSDPVSNAGSSVENVLIGGFNFEGAGIEVPGTGGGNISIASNSFTNTSVEAIGYHGNPSLAAPLGSITIVYNKFKNIGTDSQGSTASAIWLGNVVNSLVAFNKINNTAYAGITLTGTEQGNESYNNIYNNTISNIPHQGIQIAYGSNDWAVGNIVTLSGMDWNVNGSGPILGRDAAISLFNPSQDNITMVNNVLSDSYDGLAVGQVSAFSLFNDSLGSNIIFQNNNVFNLIHYGVANYAVNGTTLNAEYNWWGGPHGPNTTGSANVYGRVYYVPALSLPFNVPTASVTVNEFGLASGTVWSVTLNGTTYSTSSNSITVPNNIVLDNNTYLTEFAQGSYNISVSVGQPYYFAYWSSDTSSISFESRSAGSTVVAVNGSGTITATFGLPLDGSFTLATTPVKTVVGNIVSLNTTWRNNLPFQQVTGIVWFEVENASTGQTVMIAATSLTLTPGSSSSAYLGLSTLAPGTYNVEVFATTSQGVPISPTTTVTLTV